MKCILLTVVLGVTFWLGVGPIAGGQNTASTQPKAPNDETSAVPHFDPRHPGVYRAGRWEYQVRYERIAPPPKAEWSEQVRNAQWLWGELRFDGKPLPTPAPNSAIVTPWGLMDWIGIPGEAGTTPAGSGWGLLPFSLMPEPKPDPRRGEPSPRKPTAFDLTQNAVYRSGRWEFRTHSERQTNKRPHFGNVIGDVRWGELLLDGKPVQTKIQDCIQTPWGLMMWEGEQPLATDTGIRGPGWRPLPFILLPDPATAEGPGTRPSPDSQPAHSIQQR